MNLEIIFIIIAVSYILLWIIELIGLHRFNLRFYNYGFKVYEKTLKHKFSNWNNLDDIYNKVYKFYSDKEKMQIAQHISKTRLELIESRIKDINSRYPNVPFISADVILHQSEPFMATYKSKIINEQKANE